MSTIYEFVDSRDDLSLNIQYCYGEFEVYMKYIDTTIVFNKDNEQIITPKDSTLLSTLKKFTLSISESEFELRHYYDKSKVKKEIVKVPRLIVTKEKI